METLLLITDSEGFGGAEISLVTAASALAARGDVRVCVGFSAGNARLRSALGRPEHAGLTALAADGSLLPGGAGQVFPALRRDAARRAAGLLAESNAQRVVVNLWAPWSGAGILDAARASAGVSSVAGYLQLGQLPAALGARFGSLRNGMLRRHLARFDRLLAVSASQSQALRSVADAGLFRTVYQPVAAVRRADWPSREVARLRLGLSVAGPLIGLPGRIAFSHKGQDAAVRIALLLEREGKAADWVVVGDGPDGARLRELVTGAGLAHRFHFMGWRDDLEEIIPAFDVVALPTRYEGLPLTAVEAMAARVPVVAFAVDGLNELLDAPFAVPPFDERRFAAALARVLEDPAAWPAAERAQLARGLCDPATVAGRILDAVRG